jgi:peroxidase
LLLGKAYYKKSVGDYAGYKKNVNPGISQEFATAGFRFGHPIVNSPIKQVNNNEEVIRELKLSQMFENPRLVTDENVDYILKGLSKTYAKERSIEFIDDIRNFLVVAPNIEIKLDLYSLNIQRGRDHGLPGYNTVRQVFGL